MIPSKDQIISEFSSSIQYKTSDVGLLSNNLGEALYKTWIAVESSVQLSSKPVGAVVGGVLVGAVGLVSPGSTTASYSFKNLYQNFKTSYPQTMPALVSMLSTIGSSLDKAFVAWMTGLTISPPVQGTPVSYAAVPTLLSTGTSPGLSSINTVELLMVSTSTPPLTPVTPAMKNVYTGIANGFKKSFNIWLNQTNVVGSVIFSLK